MSAPTTRRKLQWNKSEAVKVCLIWSLLQQKNYNVTKARQLAKVSLENLVRNVLKKTRFEAEHLSQPFDNKSWY